MKLLLFIFLFVLNDILIAQLTMNIENLEMFNIKFEQGSDEIVIIEGMGIGPRLVFEGVIENNTDTTVILNYFDTKIILYFRYKGKLYNENCILWFHGLEENVTLHPQQTANVFFTADPMIITGVLQNVKYSYDYTNDMLEILPTLKIEYYEKKKIKIIASEIINVKLILNE